MDYSKCPNCDKSVKGIFSTATLLKQSTVDFINKKMNNAAEAYCTSCGNTFLNKIAKESQKQRDEITKRLEKIIHNIPVISSPAPVKWEYEIIDMVSAQTSSGGGFGGDLSRSFADFWGTTSKSTNRKLEQATNFCKADLRVQCARGGGNAVISTDIDFNEISSGSSNMTIVCMAGTAIKVTDLKNFHPKIQDAMAEISELTETLEALSFG